MNSTLLAAVLATLGTVPANPAQATAQTTAQSPGAHAKARAKEKDSTVFSDLYLGLQFTHPPTWSLTKKNRDMTRYKVAISGSLDTADLEIRRATFHSTKDIWQTIQLRANETMHREVVRQWEQVVINVPMLCTQLAYTEKSTPVTTLTGLYYTKTPLKMLVRLTAPTADFDKVKYEFDQALQSLQTTNATTPEEDDPNFKFDESKKPQLAPPLPDVIGEDAPPPPKLIKNLASADLVVSTKPVKLRFPHGWIAEGIKDNEVTLRNPKLAGVLKVSIHYALDSERPAAALIHATVAELEEYNAGVKREDTEPAPNLEDCSISTVWRFGQTAKGELCSFHASGEEGDFYFIASFRSGSIKGFREDQRLIRSLMDEISLVPGSS